MFATNRAEGIAALLTGRAGTLTLLVRSRTRLLHAAPPLDLPAFIDQLALAGTSPADRSAQVFDLLTMPDTSCDQIVLMVEEAHLLPEATLRYIEVALRASPSLQIVLAGRAEAASTAALHDFNVLRERLLLSPVVPRALPEMPPTATVTFLALAAADTAATPNAVSSGRGSPARSSYPKSQTANIAALLTGRAGTLILLVRNRTRFLHVAPPLDLPAFIGQLAGAGTLPMDGRAQVFNLLTVPDTSCDQIVLMVEEAHLLPEATLRYIEVALRASPSLQVVFAGRAEAASAAALHDFNALRERLLLSPVAPRELPAMPVPAAAMSPWATGTFLAPAAASTFATPNAVSRPLGLSSFMMGGVLAGAALAVVVLLADRFMPGVMTSAWLGGGMVVDGTDDPSKPERSPAAHPLDRGNEKAAGQDQVALTHAAPASMPQVAPAIAGSPLSAPAPIPAPVQPPGPTEVAQVPPSTDTVSKPGTTATGVADGATVPESPAATPSPEELAAALDVPRPEMVAFASTTFRMGDRDDRSEEPVHTAALPRFAIAEHATTVREWQGCVRAGVCTLQPQGKPQDPVTNVSWDDAQQFSGWLSGVTGQHYRLPTEAEWEYAARGGTITRYAWGNVMLPDHAACQGCSTTPPSLNAPPWVGAYPSNSFGLYGMGGGVAEWVADCWHRDYVGAPANGAAWTTPDCRSRVLRGGSWMEDAAAITPASREFYDASVRYPTHGFRVARSETVP